MIATLAKDDLLFHPVHGLCRVASLTKAGSSKEHSYTLLPVANSRGKIRFVLPESALEQSGFSKLISIAVAQAILKYFKSGKKEGFEDSASWQAAALIRSEARSKEPVKDARRRQAVSLAVQGLVGELAYVLELSVEETLTSLQKALGREANINPVVLNAIANIEKD